ncbi:hypothetical protein BAUCODRAFT_152789 [Baudoinia panamericana UAMH 10762]|uniref:Uncharacterized protein n=1 Tax=Baudoinia panamericana (strain UAMH 10762) TaxID=717646 RepID=M2LAU1_BAUPA|nr:uncharacterized protein BAUCODRAFT_152789 [Baudoinia panamericana UAMH 10762]EMC90932.1 hypothetical protein BAUCODRAFT_152789 [Baudoinia panamericana UAMH 10762]
MRQLNRMVDASADLQRTLRDVFDIKKEILYCFIASNQSVPTSIQSQLGLLDKAPPVMLNVIQAQEAAKQKAPQRMRCEPMQREPLKQNDDIQPQYRIPASKASRFACSTPTTLFAGASKAAKALSDPSSSAKATSSTATSATSAYGL